MSKITLDNEYRKRAFTQVDNLFLSEYLSSASGDDVKAYLAGLMVASAGCDGDFVDAVSGLTGLAGPRIRESFAYWDSRGLVERSGDDVTYLSVKAPVAPIVRYNAQKFKVFADEAARIFPDKSISPNAYDEYFKFMTRTGMETNALLLIMQYCKDRSGGKASENYILAMAQSLADEGLIKETAVARRIKEIESHSEDLRALFSELELSRLPDVDDRQLFASWKTRLGFDFDAILHAARHLKGKRGAAMARLDKTLAELASAKAVTASEIDEYMQNKRKVKDLCIKICKNVGVYYEVLDSVEKVYVAPWLNRGFDAPALIKISEFCFLRGLRTLDGMRQMVDKFASLGLFTVDGISEFVEKQVRLDDEIRAVFDKCGYVGMVTGEQRNNYRNWIEWGFSPSVILETAARFKGKNFPLAGMNRVLGELRNIGVFGSAEAKKYLDGRDSAQTKKRAKPSEYSQHKFTDEQLKSVFSNFENWKD